MTFIMNIKIWLGFLSIAVSMAGYIPYIRDTVSGKTRPHVFSWFIWGVNTAIEFFGQIAGSAGTGAWVTGVSSFVCFLIAFLGFRRGNLEITKLDWFSFFAAILAILLWLITKAPYLSVLLVIIIDILGFVPTFRKAVVHPYEETLVTWFLNGLKFLIAILALEKFTFLSAVFPVYLIIGNWLVVVIILVGRNQKKQTTSARLHRSA